MNDETAQLLYLVPDLQSYTLLLPEKNRGALESYALGRKPPVELPSIRYVSSIGEVMSLLFSEPTSDAAPTAVASMVSAKPRFRMRYREGITEEGMTWHLYQEYRGRSYC